MLTDGIDVTPQATLSTIQFHNEVLNTVVTSLMTAFVIANLGSVINRLVFLSHHDVFSFRSFARTYVFLNSDDPLRLWFWLRGRYEFRTTHQSSPTRQRIVKRHLIAPLCARLWILIVSIGSIALALPSEKRLDGCGRGDYTVVQAPLERRPVVNVLELQEVCSEIPLETRLGTVRSSASYCSYMVTPGDISQLIEIKSKNKEQQANVAAVGYDNSTGVLISLIFSGDRIETMASFVRWKTENGDMFNSLLPFWNAERHLNIIVDGLSFATDQNCDATIDSDQDDEDNTLVAYVDCSFNAEVAIRYVSAAMRESMHFRKEQSVALRSQLMNGSSYQVDRSCAIDITVTRPLINIVPLLVGLSMAFLLNLAVRFLVSRRGNALDFAFHLVREVLGHDTSANPLQQSTGGGDDVQNVALRKYICADGVSAHVGFVRGSGDTAVEGFFDGRSAGRCLQATCRGPRFVTEMGKECV